MKNLKVLFESLEAVLPKHITVNQALIKTLKINKDAASRRISGKAPLTFEEACALSKAYGIEIMPAQSAQFSNVTFGYVPFNSKQVDSKHFFQTISGMLQSLTSQKEPLLMHVAPEVPIYHCYNYPKLLNFRLFYWGKYLLNNPHYAKRIFNQVEIDATITKNAKKAYENYCSVPSLEIWTPQTIQSILSQLHFCIETGDFVNQGEVESVLEEVSKMIQRIKQMAEENNKAFDHDKKKNVPFHFYKIEVNINTSNLLAVMDDHNVCYQQFNAINFMSTTQSDFCEETCDWIKNIQSKSSLLSGAGIVERQRFFNSVTKQINEFKESLNKVDFG
ncbi:MAG: hypothetical protein V4677_11840 [Bacteroidota bacterium]